MKVQFGQKLILQSVQWEKIMDWVYIWTVLGWDGLELGWHTLSPFSSFCNAKTIFYIKKSNAKTFDITKKPRLICGLRVCNKINYT